MRVKEGKKENIKAIISHIISENPTILNVVKEASIWHHRKFTVQIKEDCNSQADKDNCHIILGIGNFEMLFQICKSFGQEYHLQYSSDNKNSTMITDTDLNIETYDVRESFWNKVKLIDENTENAANALATNALAFILYHEFGHIKYDDDSMLQIEKERTADFFAMKVLYESCSKEQNIRLEENSKFLGAFLENIFILLVSKPKDTEFADTHPHPIERIYLFLEYFHIKNDSFLWKYAYDTIVRWANDNHIATTFVNDCSISTKDKLLDFYHRYKK